MAKTPEVYSKHVVEPDASVRKNHACTADALGYVSAAELLREIRVPDERRIAEYIQPFNIR